MSSNTDGSDQGILDRLERVPFGRFHILLLALVFIAVAFDNMDQVTLSFVIPQYSREWGLTPAITRIHPALGIGGTLIGAILGGFIADRIGRKKTFEVMILLFAVTELANGFATSFAWVVSMCFIMGVGVGGAVPIAFSMISEFAPARRRGIMQIMIGVVSIGVGYVIASGAAYMLMPSLGWRFLFAIGVIPAFLIPLIWKYVPESPRYLLAKGRYSEAAEAVGKVESMSNMKGVRAISDATFVLGDRSHKEEESTRSARELWTTGYRLRTILIWVFGALWGFFNFTFIVWVPTVLINGLHFAPGTVAYSTSVADIASIPIGVLTAFVFERVGRKFTLAIYPVVGGAVAIVMGLTSSAGVLSPLTFVLLGIVLYSTGLSLAGMFPPYASELYGTSVRASGTGWAVAISRITGVLGLVAGGGLLVTGVKPLDFFFVVGIPLLLSGILMAFLGLETKQKRLEELAQVGHISEAKGVSPPPIRQAVQSPVKGDASSETVKAPTTDANTRIQLRSSIT